MDTIAEFVERYPLRHYDKHQLILCQGEVPSNLFFIKSGFVKGYDLSIQGSEQMVWFGTDHDFFPISWLFSLWDGTLFFYEAFSNLELYLVNKDAFNEFLTRTPQALYEITKIITQRYYDTMQRLNAVEKPKAEDKVTHILSYISARFSTYSESTNRNEITLPLTHQDIANLLGLTRETVAVELKKLKDQGYLYYDKWHFVIFQDKLAAIL